MLPSIEEILFGIIQAYIVDFSKMTSSVSVKYIKKEYYKQLNNIFNVAADDS